MTARRRPTRSLLTIALLAAPALVGLPALVPTPVVMAQQSVNEPAYQQFLFAYRLLQRNEDREAANAFDEYLGQFPNDERRGDALYFRAMLARKAGDLEQAAKLLTSVPPTTFVPHYAAPLLNAQVLVDLKRNDAAIAVLEKIALDKLDATAQASVLLLRGTVYRSVGNLTASNTQLTQASAIESPLKARALLELGRTLRTQGQKSEAIGALEKAMTAGDRAVAPEAARWAGDWAYADNQYPRAIAAYRTVIADYQSSPQFAPAVLGTLWAQLAAKQYEPLVATVAQHKSAVQGGDRAVALYLAGSAQVELRQFESAITALTEALALSGDLPLRDKLLYKLAGAQFEANQLDAMTLTVDRLLREHAQSPLVADGQFLLAAADAKRGDPARGVARLTAIIDQGSSHPYFASALLQRARLHERSNLAEPAASDYQKYLEAERAVSLTRDQATLRLVDLWDRLGKSDAAEKLAAQLLERKGLDPLVEQESLYRRALAQVRLSQLEPALSTFDQLLTRHPQSEFADSSRYYKGLVLLTTNKPEPALVELRAAAAAPKLAIEFRSNAYRLLAKHHQERGENPAAANALRDLEKLTGANGLRPTERLWLASHFVDARDAKTAEGYLQSFVKAKQPPTSGPEAAQYAEALFIHGRALREMNQPADAMESFGQVIALGQGMETRARLELARTLRLIGKTDEALSEFAGLLSVESSYVAANALYESALIHRQNALTQRARDGAAAARENQEARKLLKRLVLLYAFPQLAPLPEMSQVHLGEIAMELDDASAARGEFEEVMQRYPQVPVAQYAKAMLAVLDQKRGDALFLLRKLREQNLDERLAVLVRMRLRSLEATP